MARQLSLDGHKVYGTYRRDSDPLPGVTYIKADVQDLESLKNAVTQVVEAEGRIDTLISNAGMGVGGPLEFTSIEDAQRQMDVNFMGMVRLVSLVVPIMRQQQHFLRFRLGDQHSVKGILVSGRSFGSAQRFKKRYVGSGQIQRQESRFITVFC